MHRIAWEFAAESQSQTFPGILKVSDRAEETAVGATNPGVRGALL